MNWSECAHRAELLQALIVGYEVVGGSFERHHLNVKKKSVGNIVARQIFLQLMFENETWYVVHTQ